MNCKKVAEYLQDEVAKFMGDRNAIIGISGGIDSAVVAAICVKAIGYDKCYGIEMPYGDQSTSDSTLLIEFLNIQGKARRINIKPAVDAMFKEIAFFPASNKIAPKNLTNGNARARMRMNVLYAFAAECNGMVIGTGNKTEMLLGYFTKHGDGGVDIEPIADLFKTEVFELAKYYNLPEVLITKAPSAELWEGQTDEKEIGMTYAEMDEMLGTFPIEINKFKAIYGEKGEKILERVNNSEHKRNLPPTIFLDRIK